MLAYDYLSKCKKLVLLFSFWEGTWWLKDREGRDIFHCITFSNFEFWTIWMQATQNVFLFFLLILKRYNTLREYDSNSFLFPLPYSLYSGLIYAHLGRLAQNTVFKHKTFKLWLLKIYPHLERFNGQHNLKRLWNCSRESIFAKLWCYKQYEGIHGKKKKKTL